MSNTKVLQGFEDICKTALENDENTTRNVPFQGSTKILGVWGVCQTWRLQPERTSREQKSCEIKTAYYCAIYPHC